MQAVSTILVPTDFGPGATRAATRAILYAQALNSHLEFLHVVPVGAMALRSPGAGGRAGRSPLSAAQVRLDGWVAALSTHQVARESTSSVAEGDLVKIAVARSRKVELIVLASQGRDDIGDWLLGTRTQRIVARAHCDVLIVQPSAPAR